VIIKTVVIVQALAQVGGDQTYTYVKDRRIMHLVRFRSRVCSVEFILTEFVVAGGRLTGQL
jgi:hypothetical protein